MDEYEGRIEWTNYFKIIWKRKWLIIISTLLCAIIAAIYSFLQPSQWKVDAIIQGGNFFDEERNEEVVIVEGEQLAGQINEGYYDNLIVAELNLGVNELPKLKAKNLRWTQLVQISTRASDIEKAKLILNSLFKQIKGDIDKKIDFELNLIETQIEHHKNIIEMENLNIQSREKEKSKLRQKIVPEQNKLKKSEERYKNILNEMDAVIEKIDEMEKQQIKTLPEKKGESEDLSCSLYSNSLLKYFQSYTIEQKINAEMLRQEQIRGFINETEQNIRQLNAEMEQSRKNIEVSMKEINLLKEKKGYINYSQFVKEPSSSLHPVSPRKKLNILIASILGLFVFTLFAFFLEYIQKQKPESQT